MAAYSAADTANPHADAVPAIPASAVPVNPPFDAAAHAAAAAAAATPVTPAADTQMEDAGPAEMVADNGASRTEAPAAPEVQSWHDSCMAVVVCGTQR